MNSGILGRRLAIVAFCLLSGQASGQAFFADFLADPVTGVDRGSTSTMKKFDVPTGFVTLSSFGSRPIGPFIASIGYALPSGGAYGSQFDFAGVIGGPAEDQGRELAAFGLGYRIGLSENTTLYANVDRGAYRLGTAQLLPLEVEGVNTNAALGLRRVWVTGEAARLTGSVELVSKTSRADLMGAPAVDETLRLIRVAVAHEAGRPFALRRRLALSVTTGTGETGTTPSGAALATLPGANVNFTRIAFAGEFSVPLRPELYLNMGVIGQFTNDSLPLSQRCGYGSNAYARGFDQGFVNGDRCIGTRVELAYDLHAPSYASGSLSRTQGFFGIDGGYLHDNPNNVVPGGGDAWSSVSLGVRLLKGKFLGELSLTRILDAPGGVTPQKDTRIWFQSAVQW